MKVNKVSLKFNVSFRNSFRYKCDYIVVFGDRVGSFVLVCYVIEFM